MEPHSEFDRSQSYVIFQLGGEHYALEVLRVQEVLDMGALTHVPGSPNSLRGVLNLPGHVVPVWDLRIPFGLPVGWYIAMRFAAPPVEMKRALGRMLAGAALTSGFTLVVMAAIWGRAIGMLFDPAADLANFGIPLILYDPTASFAGWLALMIVVSPFLQFLVTLFGYPT